MPPRSKLKRPAIPRVKTRVLPPKFGVRRRGTFHPVEQDPYLLPPANFVGTIPEWAVYLWLVKRGTRGWEFQSSLLGGRLQIGGAVVDFLFHFPLMAWRVQGDYYHFRSQQDQALDFIQRLRLIAAGFIVVDILGSDVLNKATRDRTLDAALAGIQLRELEFLG